MCGICGIFNERNKTLVTAMLASIRHRGPDSFTTTVFENHSLGECGLNIVSAKDDVMPLLDRENDITLLFNGEIYNYMEIKEELIKDGYSFNSDADSEVIIPLYKKYGPNFVKRLKGMYAIVIVKKDKILLARDRFGIKPLHYYRAGEKLIFGSEMKALLQHPDVPAEINRDALDEIKVFGYIFSEELTPLKSIFQVPAGTVIQFTGNEFEKESYYSPQPSYFLQNSSIDYQASKDRLSEILFQTFSRLLKHGNHETGFYLSGGLDSTMMAVLSTEILNKPIKTYTLYDSAEAPDLDYARKVSAAIGSEHHEFFVNTSDYLRELPGFTYHYENIMAGGVFDVQGALAFQLLSKQISEHHKIAFTGEGADELFGGYYWIYTHPLGFSDRIKDRVSHLPENSKARKIVNDVFPQPENENDYRKNLFDILMRTGLSNYHLWSVDRSCAAFGFEIRPPYLYEDIAEFALSLPIEFKVPDKSTTKKILRDAAFPYLKKYNLTEIADREKYGMPAALGHVGPQVTQMIQSFISDETVMKHPYTDYCKNAMDVLLFDLFYYFIVYKKGQYHADFSLEVFYKERINESMYNR